MELVAILADEGHQNRVERPAADEPTAVVLVAVEGPDEAKGVLAVDPQDRRQLDVSPLPHRHGLARAARAFEQPRHDLGGPARSGAVAAEHAPAELMKGGRDPGAQQREHGARLSHPVLGRLDEPLSVSGTAALGQHGDAIDDSARQRGRSDEQPAGHDLGMAHDPAAEPGHEPVGRVVIRVIDGGMKLRPGRGGRQAGEQLQDLALLPGPSRGNLAFLEHPGRRLEGHDRVVRNVVDGSPPDLRAAADHAARRANLHRLDDMLAGSGGRFWPLFRRPTASSGGGAGQPHRCDTILGGRRPGGGAALGARLRDRAAARGRPHLESWLRGLPGRFLGGVRAA